MATLIHAGNSEGTIGRCDASCHEARLPECVCICGGRYHGRRDLAGELMLEDIEAGRFDVAGQEPVAQLVLSLLTEVTK